MIKVFFSYSSEDKKLRDELDKHLSPLRRLGIIETWHDRVIEPGKEFEQEIDSNLKDSNIILLLISASFIDSHYCYNIEMKEALNMHNTGNASVIPIILEPCDWKITFPGKLVACPTNGIAITQHKNMQEAFTNVAQSIRRVATSIIKKLPMDEEQDYLKRKANLILGRDNELVKEIETEKLLYPSEHKELISWLSDNKKVHVDNIYANVVEVHASSELSYKIPETSAEIIRFNREISQFIDQLEACLLRGNTEFIDEPKYRTQYKKNIYKLAFNYLLKRVPDATPNKSKDQFEDYINYLLKRI